MRVYQAICAVSADLAKDGISKDRKNQQQGYSFRGIDDCLNALAPLLSFRQLVIIPEVLERTVVERETKNGGALFYVTVKVQYTFTHAQDGSSCKVVTYGEAMDSADKATNKSMSAAYKYAVIQTFCIPTEGDNDADAITHDVKASASTTAMAANEKKFKAMQSAKKPEKTTTKKIEQNTGIDDVRWNEFLDYAGDDPDRMNVVAQLKEVLAIGMVTDLTGEERKSFILEFQESCKATGVPCEEWVKS
jgi:hypothetical protein